MIRFAQLEQTRLAKDPFDWAFVSELFTPQDAISLARTFPRDHFKTVRGDDGEKGYVYEARCLLAMGTVAPSQADCLSLAWKQLAADLLTTDYRATLSHLSGIDLGQAELEVNLYHYGPGCWLGPHLDLKDKILTHVFYFNERWDVRDGGCLTILRSAEMADVVKQVPPLVGNSAILVRSTKSWHAVSRVAEGCRRSRRAMTVTFYHPGSVSTMWPAGDQTALHNYYDPPGRWLRYYNWLMQWPYTVSKMLSRRKKTIAS